MSWETDENVLRLLADFECQYAKLSTDYTAIEPLCDHLVSLGAQPGFSLDRQRTCGHIKHLICHFANFRESYARHELDQAQIEYMAPKLTSRMRELRRIIALFCKNHWEYQDCMIQAEHERRELFIPQELALEYANCLTYVRQLRGRVRKAFKGVRHMGRY